jgi:hypothetical protein
MPAKKTLTAALAILFTSLACRSAPYQQDQQKTAVLPSDGYLGLRSSWFRSAGDEVGVKPDPESKVPLAVHVSKRVLCSPIVKSVQIC